VLHKNIQLKKNGIMNRFVTMMSNAMLDVAVGTLVICHPEWGARNRSNDEIRKLGPLFGGDVLNLSGWKDEDKEGGCYRDYFPNARCYVISNYGAEVGSSAMDEKELDLSKPYTGQIGTYDLVFNHTVIEHVYSTQVVFDNLALLSRDAILTIVPFVQHMHGVKDGFVDYYRYSPLALERLFEERGFKTLYVSWNEDHPLMNVYIVHVASKCPERYAGFFPPSKRLEIGQTGPGTLIPDFLWPRENERTFWRRMGDFIGYAFRDR